MAVALEELYREIAPQYGMKLQTKSCFQKVIEWMHVIEDTQFIKLLHGNELIFNSGVPYTSTEWILQFIEMLHQAGAGGLVISVHEGQTLPDEVIDYANHIRFPLFLTGWDCPYVEITRIFASILLKNEQKETNLITALKNAIYYPQNEESYVKHFERNGFHSGQRYTVVILSCHTYSTENGNPRLTQLEKAIQYSGHQSVSYQEHGHLVVLVAEEEFRTIWKAGEKLCASDKNIYIGIGTVVHCLQDIHESYEHAMVAYQLTKTAINTNLLSYERLGVYKLLSNLREPDLGESYVEEVLGKLISYDAEKKTDYVYILQKFFENECSILNAAQALYCHKNTLTYKLNKIKEILGYDIMLNDNRMRIMLAYHLLKMRQ